MPVDRSITDLHIVDYKDDIPDCDGQIYDSRVETCCDNILWAGATPYDKCCGVRVFDKRKYVCCDGELFSKREREEC